MTPMKISGSHVSMKLVTSSKNELPSAVVTGGGGVAVGFWSVAPGFWSVAPAFWSGVAGVAGAASPLGSAQAGDSGGLQFGAGSAYALAGASAATRVTRASATRRRRSGTVIQGANRQRWARALPRLV